MAVTTNYGWPKPALTDAPNGPSQIGALADAVDTTVFANVAPLLTDTGWLNITIGSGFAALAGNVPQARMLGNTVRFRGAFSSTGLSASGTFTGVGTLPGGIASPPGPAPSQFWPCASSVGAAVAHIVVGSGGSLELRLNATLGGYYQLNAVNYWAN